MDIVTPNEFDGLSKEGIKKLKANERNRRYRENLKKRLSEDELEALKEKDRIRAKESYYRNHEKNKERGRQYHLENKEEIEKVQKVWRDNNKDKIKENNQKWYEENKKARLEYDKKYYEENKEYYAMQSREYRHSNRGVLKANKEKRLALIEKQNDQSITPNFIKDIFNKANSCPYCSKKLLDVTNNRADTKTLDHLIPISKGGLHSQYNVVVCCHSCNCKKRNSSFPDWLKKLDEPYRTHAEKLYIKQYGIVPEQLVLPLTFE